MKSSGWVIIVFETEQREFDGEVAFVKGPFDQYEQAKDWAETNTDTPGEIGCEDWQIAFIEPRE
jgi:hypothetical protein